MYLASEYIQVNSDEDDFVSMSDAEMDTGIQAFVESLPSEAHEMEGSRDRDRREGFMVEHRAAPGREFSEEHSSDEAALAFSAMMSASDRAADALISARVDHWHTAGKGTAVAARSGMRSRPPLVRGEEVSRSGRHEFEALAASGSAVAAGKHPPRRPPFAGTFDSGSSMAPMIRPLLRRTEAGTDLHKKRKLACDVPSAVRRSDEMRRKRDGRKVADRREVNARVIVVDLSTLRDDAEVATGDPFHCSNAKCGAILSMHDALVGIEDVMATTPGSEETKADSGDEDANKLWVCQFCGNHNKLEIEDDEFPANETMDFLLEPPLAKSSDAKIIVFTVDTSGSMCVTTEVSGTFRMRTKTVDESVLAFAGRSDQFLPSQKKKGVTYVSRLALVQTAIESQVKAIGKEHALYKVALCSFSDHIKIFGTGHESEEQFIAGDKLKDMAKLKDIGAQCELKGAIDKMQDEFIERLYGLEESGQTCLGPALVVSIAMAAKSMPLPSTVVLATDGLANVGLGALDALSDAETDAVAHWYQCVAHWARACGVRVNIVSISDENCRLEFLGKVADATGGEVDKVDATTLRTRFRDILSREVIATRTQATMLLHPLCGFVKGDSDLMKKKKKSAKPVPKAKKRKFGLGVVHETKRGLPIVDLKVAKSKTAMATVSETAEVEAGAEMRVIVTDMESKTEEKEEVDDSSSKLKPLVSTMAVEKQVRDVGNVVKGLESSKLFFEFEVCKERREEFAGLKAVSIQVQVAYTREDGAKLLRVITRSVPLTTDRSKVLGSLKMEVVASLASRRAAELCEEGAYEEARAKTYSASVWMGRHASKPTEMRTLSGFVEDNRELDRVMQRDSREDRASGRQYSSKGQRRRMRSSRRDDYSSSLMYTSKGSQPFSSSSFK